MSDKRKAFEEWKNNEREKIPAACGCVMIEAFFHWIEKAFNAGYDSRGAEVAELKTQIDTLKRICGESYQVVGALAERDLFNELPVIKALDNLSSQQLIHEDVLPFQLPDKSQPVQAVSVPDAEELQLEINHMEDIETCYEVDPGHSQLICWLKELQRRRAAMLAKQDTLLIQDVELSNEQEADFNRYGWDKKSGLDRLALRLAMKINDGNRGLIDYGPACEFAKELYSMIAKQEPLSAAIRDVIAARQRQRNNSWDVTHDDIYIDGVLSLGGAAYAISGSGMDDIGTYRQQAARLWPFPCETFKPAGNVNRRHDLVRGAAMIVAEIEKIDRANGDKGGKS